MIKELFFTVLKMSVKASVVCILVMALRRLLKNQKKKLTYMLWLVVLFRFLCPVSVKTPVSLFSTVPQAETVIDNVTTVFVTDDAVKTESDVVINETDSIGHRATTVKSFDMMNFVSYTWLGVAILLAVRNIAEYALFCKKLAGCEQTDSDIYSIDGLNTAFITGIFRNRIFIPSNLTDSEMKILTRHERTHIFHHDNLVKFISFTAVCIHWFNPFAWIFFTLFEKDMEMFCDEDTLLRNANINRADYSQTLLNFSRGNKKRMSLCMTFSESDVKRRVVNILTPKKTKGIIVTLLTVMVVASGCAMATDSSQKSNDAEISGEIVAENQYSDASQENTDIINSVPVLYYTDIISKNESELINEYKANHPDGFLWPVPEYSYVSRQFTGRYNEGGHDGIDICGAYGTPVYAAESGIVITANYTARGYGVYVIIDHGGFETLYSHCSELTVSMGQNVSKGDLIGYIGSTGNSTGNHCHFEVKVGDTRYNPAHWFE